MSEPSGEVALNPLEVALNPLEEAKTTSLDELFSRDPLRLTRADLEVMVAQLRIMRDRFLQEEAAPKAPKGPKPKAAKVVLSLSDLGLG